MNAVVVGVLTMLALSIARMNVVLAVFLGAIVAGVVGGLGLSATMEAFTHGLGGGSSIALSYVLLGGFASALAHSGIPNWLAAGVAKKLQAGAGVSACRGKLVLLLGILLMAIASQNIIPVHIAFIPILIPPLLMTFRSMQLDRRVVACVLVFGLCATYLIVPFGFGNIYLTQILGGNLAVNGVSLDPSLLPLAMAMPVSGMLVGLLWAVFVSYRKPRQYKLPDTKEIIKPKPTVSHKARWAVVIAVSLALVVQIVTGSILQGAAAGFIAMVATGVVPWREADGVFSEGMKIMAFAGFVMMAAAGFGEVLRQTGDVSQLVNVVGDVFGNHKGIAALSMLVVGLLITMGIGSSFSTVPIIATIFVPLSVHMGFSPMATAVILGTAGALGDAGSPASESSIGPTIGLNADGEHDHIRDTVMPTFLHYSIPMILFGWAAAMLL
ncbi:MAG: Na+/H+ antiporter NhaC family protein [Endozoicomonas sp. (ex Botrylloides leachii)]|nr:Na+/H+ antiporter NhaC family protein [Endozoicomonas sp. (ex Botrylloides leachii)]